jgi:CelD/BcsL family acetyltransferase involved in cellulose biosynthesis
MPGWLDVGIILVWIMSAYTILELSDPRWEKFVASHPSATPFHHPGWVRLVAGCYGFRGFAVTASDTTGQIRAGLPVVEVSHFRIGPRWVSLPFTDYCAPLVSDPQEEADLVCALQQASTAAGVRRVEVRAPLAGAPVLGPAMFRHVISLDGGPEAVYQRFRRTARQQVRRAQGRGVTVRRATRPEDLTDIFYRLHARNRRRLGVPVQPSRFFRMLWDSVIGTGLGLAFIAEASGRPVAAHVCLAWNGTMTDKFSASDDAAWPLRPNHLIIWHALQAACQIGCQWFDFGRTDACNEGLRVFKKTLGAVEEPLAYGVLGAEPEPATVGLCIMGRLLGSAIRHGPLVLCRAAGEALYRYAA